MRESEKKVDRGKGDRHNAIASNIKLEKRRGRERER